MEKKLIFKEQDYDQQERIDDTIAHHDK